MAAPLDVRKVVEKAVQAMIIPFWVIPSSYKRLYKNYCKMPSRILPFMDV